MDRWVRRIVFYFLGVLTLLLPLQRALGYDINLSNQWNLISLPEQPANTAIDKVTTSIADKFNSIWAYGDGSWKMYDPQNPNFSDLLTMEVGRGYWIDMKQSGTLSGSGAAAPSSVLLIAGWNLVGYGCKSLAISSALASIAGKYDSVWTFKEGVWKLYDPSNPNFSDLTTIDPGLGYWINAKESTTWTCQDDYSPKPVVPRETTPESSGKVTLTGASPAVSLSDGTKISLEGMGQGSSLTITLDRASNTINTGSSHFETSGSMRTITIDGVLHNGTDDISAFAPVITLPQKEIGSLNVSYVNVMRVSTNSGTGQEEQSFFSVFRDQKGDLVFRDWVLPTDILEYKTPSVTLEANFIGQAGGPKVIKYSPITIQNEGNTAVPAQLVRMVPSKEKGWNNAWRNSFDYLSDPEKEKELKKPVQNVIIFVHGHNEMEKVGFELINAAEPWWFDYKRDVWNYMYTKFSSDFGDRMNCTVFYEFIYPTWRSIYTHLNSELARLVMEKLEPQLKNGMRFNLFIVAHSMGGVVSRAGLQLFEAKLKDSLQRLVTWGSPHHGAALNSLRFALTSPALSSRWDLNNIIWIWALRRYGAPQVAPTQGVLDLRWTTFQFVLNGIGWLTLPKMFELTDPQATKDWDTSSGKWLYNSDLEALAIADQSSYMANKYTFLYGITEEGLRLDDWSEFDTDALKRFDALSEIGKGATLAYVLMNRASDKFMDADVGDSDGVAPVISMSGWGITPNYKYLGHMSHEDYFASSTHASLTADETYKAMDFRSKLYDPPENKLTLPTIGQIFKVDAKVPIAGQLVWPGDAKPGKRIKEIEIRSSSSGKSIILRDFSIKEEEGEFSGEFPAGDLADNNAQTLAASVLSVILRFKDDTELEGKPAGPVTITVGVTRSGPLPVCGEGNPPATWPQNFTATVKEGIPPFTYEWNYHGSIKNGDRVTYDVGGCDLGCADKATPACSLMGDSISVKVTDSKGNTGTGMTSWGGAY